MLTHLHISNFAIVRALEIEWAAGMTTITGETGAGKSISLDALALCLGERADGLAVRPGADKADLVATFDVSRLPAAQQWLSEQDLSMGPECIIRRVIGPEGRSRGYINGVQVPAQQLRALGQHLLSIHGQHAHQLLLKAEQQKQLLDAYAGHHELYGRCRSQWKLVQQLRTEYQALQQSQQQREAQRQLLEYQVAELDQFAPQADEFGLLEQEHQRLSHASSLIETSQQALQLLYEQEDANAFAMLRQVSHLLADAVSHDQELAVLGQMVDEALVQIEEASRELRRYGDRVEIDPQRLAEIDLRMAQWLSLSRKHQIAPDTLYLHHQLLAQQFAALAGDDSRLQELELQIQQALRQYAELATQLSESRQAAAIDLSEKIARIMADLSMHNALFHIDVQPQLIEKASSGGWDQIDFLVSTNPGQPLQPLHKVASGGELSRISLAIQVILAERVTTPTLIFDEVDVGISGPVAASVGRLLRQLGANTQLICVTHLPQVASQGHQQMFVEKYTDGVHTETRMRLLNDDARVQEIARLLAGENVSQHAIANARELLCAP